MISKAYIAPLTALLIPKLELVGAVIALRIAEVAVRQLGLRMQKVRSGQTARMFSAGFATPVDTPNHLPPAMSDKFPKLASHHSGGIFQLIATWLIS